MARKPSPFHCVFAFFDPLLRRTAPVVELHYPLITPAQVRDNETHTGKQLALVQFHFDHAVTGLVPALHLIGKTLVENLWRFGWPANRTREQMLNGALQILVGRKTYRIQVVFFQKGVDVGIRRRSVPSEESAEIRIAVTGHDWLQHAAPIVGAMDPAIAKQRSFQVPKLIEAEQRMMAGAAKASVVRRALLTPIGPADRTIQIQNQFANRSALPNAIDPFARQVRTRIKRDTRR